MRDLFKAVWARLAGSKVVTAVAGPQLTATICGHETARSGRVDAFGEYVVTTMPVNEQGTVDYCLGCLGKMAIRCAWCGGPIFIADPVTLYSPIKDGKLNKNFVLREGAIRHSEKTGAVVGCLRMECADTGADCSGFWAPGPDHKGMVVRVPSPIELAMSSGRPVIVSNVGDPKEALALTAAMAQATEEKK